jgi:simple sugar transport system substrate-binding protein
MRVYLISLLLLLLISNLAISKEKVVVITHGQAADPFWSVVKNGLSQAAIDFDVDMEYHAPETFDMAQMARIIDAAVAKRPDGIVVSIPDKDALARSILGARKRGIPVISINSGEEHKDALDILLHVGQSEYLAGLGAGSRFLKAGAKRGLCINQEQGNTALDLRCEGFKKGMAVKSETLAVTIDPTEIRNATTAYLKRHKEIDSILSLGVIAAPSIVAAVEKSGRIANVKIATFDSSPEVLKAIRDKKIEFAIDQQQYLQGYIAIQSMAQYTRYGLIATGSIQTGPGFITAENASKVINLSKKGIR